jgi:hypothetical protein
MTISVAVMLATREVDAGWFGIFMVCDILAAVMLGGIMFGVEWRERIRVR